MKTGWKVKKTMAIKLQEILYSCYIDLQVSINSNGNETMIRINMLPMVVKEM